MVLSFILNDIVWCQGQNNEFVPGKVVTEESSGEWQKDEKLFVQPYHTGPGRKPRGKWVDASGLVLFEIGKDDAEMNFASPSLNKVFSQAKEEYRKNRRFSAVGVERCNDVEELKTPVQTKRRGRPPKSEGAKSSGKKVSIKKTSIKTTSNKKASIKTTSTKKTKILSRMLQDSTPKNQV